MEGLHVRTYQKSDVDDVWALHNLALTSVGAHAGRGPWDDDLKNIEAAYLNASGDFLVALMDSKIVGMGAFRKIDPATAEIKRMRVHPEYQRQGIGTVLLKQLEARAKQLGYRRFILDTTVKQIAAQKLYEKFGYHQTGRAERGGFECILYEKEI
jgi:ribosomal protein S18 acetylase RimI-like enzyme